MAARTATLHRSATRPALGGSRGRVRGPRRCPSGGSRTGGGGRIGGGVAVVEWVVADDVASDGGGCGRRSPPPTPAGPAPPPPPGWAHRHVGGEVHGRDGPVLGSTGGAGSDKATGLGRRHVLGDRVRRYPPAARPPLAPATPSPPASAGCPARRWDPGSRLGGAHPGPAPSSSWTGCGCPAGCPGCGGTRPPSAPRRPRADARPRPPGPPRRRPRPLRRRSSPSASIQQDAVARVAAGARSERRAPAPSPPRRGGGTTGGHGHGRRLGAAALDQGARALAGTGPPVTRTRSATVDVSHAAVVAGPAVPRYGQSAEREGMVVGEGTKVDGRRARGIRTRDAIVSALIDLIAGGDIAPTAQRIADRAGVSVRSVYQHFTDVEGLYADASQPNLRLGSVGVDGHRPELAVAASDRRVRRLPGIHPRDADPVQPGVAADRTELGARSGTTVR